MSENKTQPTGASVTAFLDSASTPRRRHEGHQLLALMHSATGEDGVMWGPSIVGFGLTTYVYASGRTGTWPRVGFSPRKAALSLYGLKDHPASGPLLAELGPHKVGASCLYVTSLDRVDLDVLTRLVELGYAHYA
ncbi:DUF1801 domain-containing protein [Demequina globuliformis]|uniref:DUF1801 domain-containing protein n=1 Tax=Demequina globuliformis TaxID=676202 RepID=UPI000785D393|nr:DUF1801 domain-containing protein [Demequina globuliformis]